MVLIPVTTQADSSYVVNIHKEDFVFNDTIEINGVDEYRSAPISVYPFCGNATYTIEFPASITDKHYDVLFSARRVLFTFDANSTLAQVYQSSWISNSTRIPILSPLTTPTRSVDGLVYQVHQSDSDVIVNQYLYSNSSPNPITNSTQYANSDLNISFNQINWDLYHIDAEDAPSTSIDGIELYNADGYYYQLETIWITVRQPVYASWNNTEPVVVTRTYVSPIMPQELANSSMFDVMILLSWVVPILVLMKVLDRF